MATKPVMAQDKIRSFGRVQGRKLRDGQTHLIEKCLPEFAINLDAPLQLTERKLWLEIGFGHGEHLAGMAMQYPDVDFIGCEPFINGVAALLKHIDENKINNIKILRGDARLLIEKLPDCCIERLFILFPDPWPKLKHHKKRIISDESLQNFSRIIKKNGRHEIATDHVAYGNWIEKHLSGCECFLPNKAIGYNSQPQDWIATRYQQKALEQGRQARFFNYVKA